MISSGVLSTEEKSGAQIITSGRYEKGYRYNIQGWVFIHIEGEPYERGYQYGYLASAEIADMIKRWSVYTVGTKFLKIFSIKTPEQGWKIYRSKAMNTFLKQIPEEYIQEMKGMVDGIRKQNGQIFGRNIEFEDIVASQFVQEINYIFSTLRKGFHPIRGLLNGLKEVFSEQISNNENDHCNAFIATGDATSDGEIVVSHASIFPIYVAQRCNIILDVKPSEGYRFVMTGPPGSLWSDEDWYQNEKGIILTETELVPQGSWKIRGTIPKGVRSRTAIQYSDSIDEVIQNLKDRNNGLIPNEWLIGDTKTGEIASYMQALYNTPIKRTFNGYYWSSNLPQDMKVLGELMGWPPIILKIGSKIVPKNKYLNIEGETVIWKNERTQKLIELGKQYYGEIDVEIAKKMMATEPLSKNTIDCKITSSKVMKNLGVLTFFGRVNGILFNPSSEDRDKFNGITELPPCGWLEVYPFNGDPLVLQSTDISDFKEKNSRVLWQYETDNIGNMNYSSSIVDENTLFAVTSSGIVYAIKNNTGKKIWSKSIGEKSVDPVIYGNLLYVGTNNGLHALNKKTGEIVWEQLVGDVFSKPVICKDIVIASFSNDEIHAFGLNSGNEMWSFKFDSPAYISEMENDMIYVGSGVSCFGFDINNKEIFWESKTSGLITASPKIVDRTVFVGSWDGGLYALNANTGDLKWKYETGWGIDSTPAVSDGIVFVGSLDNNFYAVNEDTGDVKWFYTCKAAIHSNPIVYGEYVFFGCDDGRFYALNKTDGELAWTYSSGYSIKEDNANNYITTPILSNPFVKDGVVYFGANGSVYALDAQTFETRKDPSEKESDIRYDMVLLMGILAIIAVFLIFLYLRIKGKITNKEEK
jgi:outer membrane protein assembly factor BamB